MVVAPGVFLVAAWTLIPDKVDDDAARGAGRGVLGATLTAFFLAEMGDRTQITAVVLAVQYHPLWHVVANRTLGMRSRMDRRSGSSGALLRNCR